MTVFVTIWPFLGTCPNHSMRELANKITFPETPPAPSRRKGRGEMDQRRIWVAVARGAAAVEHAPSSAVSGPRRRLSRSSVHGRTRTPSAGTPLVLNAGRSPQSQPGGCSEFALQNSRKCVSVRGGCGRVRSGRNPLTRPWWICCGRCGDAEAVANSGGAGRKTHAPAEMPRAHKSPPS